MSNQIVISSGAKVRSLEGVLTGSAGIVNSVPLGGANGVATLDSSGKVPVSQLPASVVTYLGTWNAATNTPTLTNGVGDAGDLYICNVAGTVNFGAGPITFAVGDWVIYGSGTWQKSSGQNGTVTSVAVTSTGNDAISITGSPITTAGTINIGFTGDNTQYINGAGDLTTFPSLTGYVPYTGATTDVDLGVHVLNAQALHVKGTAGAGHLGLKHQSAAATGSANESLIYANVDGDLAWQNDNLYLTTLSTHANTANRVYTFPDENGTMAMLEGTQTFSGAKTFSSGVTISSTGTQPLKIANYATSLTSTSGYTTIGTNAAGFQLLNGGGSGAQFFYAASPNAYYLPASNGTIALTSDIPSLSGYVPYTGATSNVDLGSHNLTTTGDLFAGSVTGGGIFAETNVGGAGYIYLKGNGAFGILSIYNSIFANGYKYGFDVQGGTTGAAKRAYLDFGSLTNSTTRTYSFPDASGTLALTSDIPSLTGYVPYTGATSDVNLGYRGISASNINIDGYSFGDGGAINFKQFTSVSLAGTGYTSIGANSTNILTFGFNQGSLNLKGFKLDVAGLTTNVWRTYTMPNADGTIALTSDIPSLANYVTLTGTQTITGVKTFSNEQLFSNGLTINGGYLTFADSGFSSTLDTTTLTASRAILLPNASGTIALTSDIPSLSGYIQGSGTTNYLPKFTGASTIGNSQIQDDGTSVGIGGSPNASYKLAVTGAGNFTGALRTSSTFTSGDTIQLGLASTDGGFWTWGASNSFLVAATGKALNLNPNGASGTTGLSIATTGAATFSSSVTAIRGYMNGTDGDYSFFVFGGSTAGSSYGLRVNAGGNSTDYAIRVKNAAQTSDYFVVRGDGNVGIGTSSPSEILEVFGPRVKMGDGGGFELNFNTTTFAAFRLNGTERMRITSGGKVCINTTSSNNGWLSVQGAYGAAAIDARGAAGEWTYYGIASSTSGSSNGLLLYAGTTSADVSVLIKNQSGSSDYFQIRGDGLILSPSTYNVTTASAANMNIGTAGDFRRSTSSIKYKTDVLDYDKGLAEVMQMRPVYYKGINDGDNQFAGLIAEEVHDLGLTEFVQYAEDGTPDALAYQNMIALLTKAIQELSAKVTALENKI